MRGLVGDSTITSLVLPGMIAACTALQREQEAEGGLARITLMVRHELRRTPPGLAYQQLSGTPIP
jgi:hypothetical protein